MAKYFVECLNRDVYYDFLMIRLSSRVSGEEDYRAKVLFSSHHIKGTDCQHDLPLCSLVEKGFVRFLHFKATLFAPFCIPYSSEERRYAYTQPTLMK